MVYEKLSKNALYCMYAAGAVTGGILLAVIGAVDYFWIFPEDIVIGKWISLAAAALILVDVLISPYFRFCRYRYGINEECIDIQEGYLFVKRHIVPIERLHKLEMKTADYTPGFVIPRDRGTAVFDTDKLRAPLTLRLWQRGDSFCPFGMKGRKKVSDYLTDRKFSLLQKERQWVLCSGEDIAWLVGERSDNRFRVDEQTRRVTIIRILVKE